MVALDPGTPQYSMTNPAGNAEAITPSDTVDMTYICRGIYVGVAGNVVVIPAGSKIAVTFVGVPAGYVLPVCASRVNNTNTTATNLVALW